MQYTEIVTSDVFATIVDEADIYEAMNGGRSPGYYVVHPQRGALVAFPDAFLEHVVLAPALGFVDRRGHCATVLEFRTREIHSALEAAPPS